MVLWGSPFFQELYRRFGAFDLNLHVFQMLRACARAPFQSSVQPAWIIPVALTRKAFPG
jgi:hypothetical protein